MGHIFSNRSSHDFLSVIATIDRKEVNLKNLHEGMHQIFKTLPCATEWWFRVAVLGQRWNCYPLVASYCCGFPEIRYIHSVKHGRKPYLSIRYLTTRNDISTLLRSSFRKGSSIDRKYEDAQILPQQYGMLQMKGKRSQAPAKKEIQWPILDNFLLHSAPWMFLDLHHVTNNFSNEQYLVPIVESLHLLHLGISKHWKERTVGYSFSTWKENFNIRTMTTPRKLNFYPLRLFDTCCRSVASYKKDFLVSDLHVFLSLAQKTGEVNRGGFLLLV